MGNGLQASDRQPRPGLELQRRQQCRLLGTTLNFNITGGGAQFQLGPDVTSAQQARIGINSVSTASLGGFGRPALRAAIRRRGVAYQQRSHRRPDLRSGDQPGRRHQRPAGAFQSTTLNTNVNSLTSTLANLTSAKSDITDADFAAETANLEQCRSFSSPA